MERLDAFDDSTGTGSKMPHLNGAPAAGAQIQRGSNIAQNIACPQLDVGAIDHHTSAQVALHVHLFKYETLHPPSTHAVAVIGNHIGVVQLGLPEPAIKIDSVSAVALDQCVPQLDLLPLAANRA